MSEKDVELYHRIQQGDKHALELLYDRYEKLLYSFSFKLTGQRELSEEVVQEVFIKIWTKKGIYNEHKGKFSSWILTVARNTGIDMIRKKKEVTYSIEERDSISSHEPLTEDLVEWKEEGARIRDAISSLAKEQREIVDLLYFKGLSQQKIADACQLPLGTVKGRVRLALQHLKKRLTIHEKGGQKS
ncbi:RNA polymerase sigma factor [Litchfieldia salsa]|uniref:RNA polymerase sigma factor n=1 Tax=Litchfieldia salsa TaxID=930152 RepID=A0A1H0W437_9BACI|nr:sigma-70 family RNA polymerase sigma factor [Litchfieldia salsa]SDP85499.1 RNA polymerase sigma-70 factor, ECF subfamily [Litchfieldia salsa]